MGLSYNEERARDLGISLSEYKASSEYKERKAGKSKKEAKKDKKKKEAKKDKKKSEKYTKKYYKEKEEAIKTEAKIDITRLQEDLERIYEEAGITQTRAIEDYTRNLGNIEANKAADIDDLNYYVSTGKTRTQEDLDTSLAKETRRFSIEMDKVNEDLAAKGLTFSERKPEQLEKGAHEIGVADIERVAQRSFQDIARYEVAKDRDIELKYGALEEEEKVIKTRTLEDVLRERKKAEQTTSRNISDVQRQRAYDIRDIGYERKDVLSDISNYYKEQEQRLSNWQQQYSVTGF